ncbi:MAG: tetratricopeptide repeat protein, partial [Verrucomicrobia bacterium]|nr:tetratricopeptide repeat protein [Verrucomicrobiota bacterium]
MKTKAQFQGPHATGPLHGGEQPWYLHSPFIAKGTLVAGLLSLAIPGSAPLAYAQDPAPTSTAELDTRFNDAVAAFNSGNFDLTISIFSELLKLAKPGPALEPVYFTIANAKLRKGDNDGAVEAFQQYLRLYPNGSQINDARAGLTKALIGAKRMPEALIALKSLKELRARGGAQGIDNYASLLGLTVDIADSLLDEKKPDEALAILQSALNRKEILIRQRARIGELTTLHNQAAALAGTGALAADSSLVTNRDALAARLADAKDALKRVEENPAFDLPRLLRQARCHMELDQPWEATVAYQEILTRFPTAPDRVYALHGLIIARQTAKRLAEAQALAQRFLTEFASNPLAGEVAMLGGEIALQQQDAAGAAAFFGSAIEMGQGAVKERAIFQLGNTRFTQNDWSGARENFDRYVREYPSGQWAENASYRSAITWFLAQDYAKAEEAIKEFVQKHPDSIYLPDAYYRLAVCLFAFQEYPKAITACDEWEQKYPTGTMLPELLSLKGDVLKTMDRSDDALETYKRAAKVASSDEVLDYTLNEIGRLLEEKKDWNQIITLFSEQLDRQPDSPLALGWVYWVARAKSRAGQANEAWDFLMNRVSGAIENPANEDVEKILVLMAQIRAKQKPVAGAAPAAVAPTEELAGRLHLGAEAP